MGGYDSSRTGRTRQRKKEEGKTVPTEITFSELETFGVCPWQWYARYVLLKRPKRKSVKLHFGGAIHKGIEAFYTRQGDPLAVVADYCNWVRQEAVQNGTPLDDEYDLTLKKSLIMMEAYVARYAGDFDLYNILSVEPKFSIPLTPEITISGKIDRIVTEKRTGMFFPVESKTAAQWNPDVNRLMLDFQISLYSWAVSKLLSLQDVTFLYDVMRKPAIRLKKNETEADFLIRLKENVIGEPGEYFFRDKITRSRREIDRTEREILIRSKELLEKRQNLQIYRTPGDHCHWRCDYMPPCLEDTPEMWDTLYTTVETPHEELLPVPE